MTMIKAVLIDIDDTIFDFEKCSKNAFKKTLKKLDLFYEEKDFSYFNKVNDILWTKQKLGELNINQVFIERSNMMRSKLLMKLKIYYPIYQINTKFLLQVTVFMICR